MAEMVVRVPAHLEKFEREVGLLRRNSTGGLGIQMAKYKVMSRYLSVRTGSCHDACKGVECEQQTTKTRTSLLSKSVAGKLPIPRGPLLDNATNKSNQGIRMAKDTGVSVVSKKKAIRKPANMEKIESELDCLRRNSTGNLGIEMGNSKVLSCRVRVPTGSSLDTNKAGAERNLKTKARSHMFTRSVTSGENTEMATTVKWQKNKKSLSSTNTPGNFRSLTASHGEEMPPCTKRLAVSVSHQSDLKPTALEEKAYDMSISNKLSRRRYSDSLISRGSPIIQGPQLDATSTSKTGCKMDIHMPTNLDKIESKAGFLRRNSTGSLGIERSKVLPCFLSVPTGSHQEVSKYAVERDLKTKAGTLQPTRSVTTSGVVPEMVTNVKLQVRKKPLSSSNQPKLNSWNTFRGQGQDIPGRTKIAVSLNHRSDLKLKPLKDSTSSMSRSSKLRSRRYSDILISGGSPLLRSSVLDGATNRLSKGNKPETDTESSPLSKKKNPITISLSTRSSVNRVSGKKSNSISLRMASERNKRASYLSKTGKVRHEGDLNKVSQLNRLTSFAQKETVKPCHEKFPNNPSQLSKSASLKQGKIDQGNQGSVPKETSGIREKKINSLTLQLSRVTQKAKVSSLDGQDRDGPKRGSRSSNLHSRSSSLLSDSSSSRNIINRKSSLSSISVCESFDGDATVGSFKRSGTTSQSQSQSPDVKTGRTAIGSPKNLIFRRGKIIDFQSEKLSPVRRLKFRPPKILDNSEYGSAYVRGRSSRRLIAAGRSNAFKDEAMKVNLRHQARGDHKKECPILFNNVLEETATKLVETRRSKVKALVGAFETIISLQDPRSSPPLIWR